MDRAIKACNKAKAKQTGNFHATLYRKAMLKQIESWITWYTCV